MTSDSDDTKQEKGLPGWAVAIILISMIVLLILVLITIPKLHGTYYTTLSQNSKTSKFKQKYKSYIDQASAKYQDLKESEILDIAASQALSDLTSKENFDLKQYRQFVRQLPSDIKQNENTGRVIRSKDETIKYGILKDMYQYIDQEANPTLEGAITFIEKDSLQNLIMKHTGRSQASYTQLYRPFYKQALQQRNRKRNRPF